MEKRSGKALRLMLRAIIIFLLFFGQQFNAGAQTGYSDGPYVFYKADSIILYNVSVKDTSYIADRKAALLSDVKSPFKISIRPFESSPNGFDLCLKKLNREPSEYPKPSKLFIVSDIEGEFAAFQNLLVANNIMDKKYGWVFGNGHLVICGDLFDRGKQVIQYLWLLYKLEDEAKEKGGYVHVILGNHDIMNLSGDFRYVQPQYFAGAAAMGIDYHSLYSDSTELGRWLRTKNVMEKIGDILFLHAGISPEINRMGLSLQTIDDSCRPYYAVETELPKGIAPLFGDNGPFWYRGYYLEPRATEAQVDSSLNLFNCRQIIAGHTIIKNITVLYNGKVIGIDVNHHEGNSQALMIEGDVYYRVDDKGIKLLMPK